MADVVMLEEPKYDPAKYKMIQPKADADWYQKSYVASKDALKQIQIGWGTLESKSPMIVEFLKISRSQQMMFGWHTKYQFKKETQEKLQETDG